MTELGLIGDFDFASDSEDGIKRSGRALLQLIIGVV
jgi:hypothetical protein